MTKLIQTVFCVALVSSVTGCASIGGHSADAARDRLFRQLHGRIGKGELLHAYSPEVGKLLQADQWLSDCSVSVTYGGLGQGPFYPRIMVSFYPDPNDRSPYGLTIHFSGREIQSEQDAEAFLLGRFSADDPIEDPYVTGYLMADSVIMYRFRENESKTSRREPNAGAFLTPGGFADGFRDSIATFVHLEYEGAGWNDGMATNEAAGKNFLQRFHKLSGGQKVADRATSITLTDLARTRITEMPPLIYMTGSDKINVDDPGYTTLRKYLLGGGTLLADCDAPKWDASFRKFAGKLFPELDLVQVADDDPLFLAVFSFQSGAPPLWGHGGKKLMGMKYKGRWLLLYHPGDLNDAWKTGRSGLDKLTAGHAVYFGVNVLYYAHMVYLRETRRYRGRYSNSTVTEVNEKVESREEQAKNRKRAVTNKKPNVVVTTRVLEVADPEEIPRHPDPDTSELDRMMADEKP